ncbi:FKBP-type peptidyl-prolyl cis-trans isomerase [Croceitalea sp. MTPC9]|uniref:FKBP-type peptidyl-prolyl cis-trans isomerase n=1 Tax=unclassified Croceitalea TaxID=2632280 RepID=UPI002B398738|nr:FKBP-type peptidyl-prolyl cis-trans isomerase [Croceitalea sp. MTPC6]GMN18017.1 FKBP-type peptidyl-prolyl cis-trans isomerase [Croceitalea sp. MTPC9]
MKRILSVLSIALLFVSCGNDDENNFESVPPRLLSEVEPEDRAEIIAFLKTHFYNYEEFQSPPADFDFKIKVDTIAGDNANKIPLIQQVDSAIINISANEFALSDGEEDIPHQYYYLNARTGITDKPNPTVADSVFVRYEGKLLNGISFDGSVNSAVWFDLSRIQAPLQGFRGFSEAMVNFKQGGNPIVNPDGTFSVEDYGIGMMILPSGLGGFNNITGGIPQYSPLIFEIDLFTINTTDHDGDGIPSIQEDLNGNGFLYDDNTDEAEERAAGFQAVVNFLDLDDDDDGVSTRDEISDENGNIIFPYPSTGNVPDYLNKDVQRTPSDN